MKNKWSAKKEVRDRKQPGAKNSYKTTKRWSKLQKSIYELFADDLDLQLQCRPTRNNASGRPLSHCNYCKGNAVDYWFTLGKGDNQEVIFSLRDEFKCTTQPECEHADEISLMSQVIRDYIDCPKEELLTKQFENDKWGFTNILRAADRRLGKRKSPELAALILTSGSKWESACLKILEKRFGSKTK